MGHETRSQGLAETILNGSDLGCLWFHPFLRMLIVFVVVLKSSKRGGSTKATSKPVSR